MSASLQVCTGDLQLLGTVESVLLNPVVACPCNVMRLRLHAKLVRITEMNECCGEYGCSEAAVLINTRTACRLTTSRAHK